MENIQHYKELLTNEKTKLESELSSIGRRNPSNKNDWEAVPQETGKESDKNDAADLIEGFEENIAILKDLEIRYNNVLSALERIEKNTYRKCTECGAEITEERLNADSAAAVCVEHMNN